MRRWREWTKRRRGSERGDISEGVDEEVEGVDEEVEGVDE